MQEELYLDLVGTDLSCELFQSGFILVCGSAHEKLFAEIFGEPLFEPVSGLVVHLLPGVEVAKGLPQLFLGRLLHSDEEAAAFFARAGPALDVTVQQLPSAQVEVADTEVRALGYLKSILQPFNDVGLDIVKDGWQCLFPPCLSGTIYTKLPRSQVQTHCPKSIRGPYQLSNFFLLRQLSGMKRTAEGASFEWRILIRSDCWKPFLKGRMMRSGF